MQYAWESIRDKYGVNEVVRLIIDFQIRLEKEWHL